MKYSFSSSDEISCYLSNGSKLRVFPERQIFSQLFSPYCTSVAVLGFLRAVVFAYPSNGDNLGFHNVIATLQIPPKVQSVILVHGQTDTINSLLA